MNRIRHFLQSKTFEGKSTQHKTNHKSGLCTAVFGAKGSLLLKKTYWGLGRQLSLHIKTQEWWHVPVILALGGGNRRKSKSCQSAYLVELVPFQ